MAHLSNQGVASQAAFGQLGSAFLDSDSAYTPPSGRVVVAITLIEDSVFASGGLSQEAFTLGHPPASLGFFGSNGADDTYSGGGIGNAIASNVFPKGLTIYGRWDSVDLASGACILYFGPAASPIQTA